MGQALLKLEYVGVNFGGLKAVSALDLELGEGELIGLIGPNGAGKTTVFNLITGVYAPTSGNILFAGRSIVGLKPHRIAHVGITRTFQNVRLFPSMTSFENVCVAAHQHARAGLAHAVLRTRKFREDEAAIRRRTSELLEAMGLSEWAGVRAGQLPYGQQRRLEVARALAGGPKLLLLDEPAAGLNPQETEQLMHLIETIRERLRVAILLIEHDMRVVMGVCRRIVVLDYGVKIAEGTPQEIRTNAKVIEAYLGEEVPADLGGGAATERGGK